jgi:integrase
MVAACTSKWRPICLVWFWKYYVGGKEKRLALGHYSRPGSAQLLMSLNSARDARDEARKLLEKGIDPAQHKRLTKLSAQAAAGESFEFVARKLHATKHAGWSPRYADRWIERMEKDLFPWIGSLPLKDITAPLLLQTLRLDGYQGSPLTQAALELSALLFQRPGNIRQMEWSELDLDGELWTIPAAKMKRSLHGKLNGRPHLVPLAPPAVAVLESVKSLSGHGRFVGGTTHPWPRGQR